MLFTLGMNSLLIDCNTAFTLILIQFALSDANVNFNLNQLRSNEYVFLKQIGGFKFDAHLKNNNYVWARLAYSIRFTCTYESSMEKSVLVFIVAVIALDCLSSSIKFTVNYINIYIFIIYFIWIRLAKWTSNNNGDR